MNFKIKIPDDVRDYVRKKIAFRIFRCVLFEAIMLALILLIGERVFQFFDTFPRLLIYIVLMLLPFPLTGVPFKLIDKGWEGEIIKVDVRMGYTTNIRGSNNRLVTQNVVYLTVKLTDGSIVEKRAKSYNTTSYTNDWGNAPITTIKPEHFLKIYKIGNKVYHFYGLQELMVVDPDENESSLISCAVCGQENDRDRKKCWSCGHTLIKFE